MKHSEEIISILQEEIAQYDNRTRRSESGTILEIGDGIATVYGLDRVVYGELVEFETGARGIALNLERDSVGVVLLGSEAGLHEGSWVKRTGRPADVPVGEELIGRTVNALGEPIDGLGPIASVETRPIEHEASGVVTREPVNQPLQTGILAIAALKLGADSAEGVDIDPMCVRTAGENAARNGVADRFKVLVGDLSDKASGQYNIITANIVAAAILSLAPHVPVLMAPGARFIASGIIDERKDEVLAGLKAAGLEPVEVKEKRGWVCIICEKKEA